MVILDFEKSLKPVEHTLGSVRPFLTCCPHRRDVAGVDKN